MDGYFRKTIIFVIWIIKIWVLTRFFVLTYLFIIWRSISYKKKRCFNGEMKIRNWLTLISITLQCFHVRRPTAEEVDPVKWSAISDREPGVAVLCSVCPDYVDVMASAVWYPTSNTAWNIPVFNIQDHNNSISSCHVIPLNISLDQRDQ